MQICLCLSKSNRYVSLRLWINGIGLYMLVPHLYWIFADDIKEHKNDFFFSSFYLDKGLFIRNVIMYFMYLYWYNLKDIRIVTCSKNTTFIWLAFMRPLKIRILFLLKIKIRAGRKVIKSFTRDSFYLTNYLNYTKVEFLIDWRINQPSLYPI